MRTLNLNNVPEDCELTKQMLSSLTPGHPKCIYLNYYSENVVKIGPYMESLLKVLVGSSFEQIYFYQFDITQDQFCELVEAAKGTELYLGFNFCKIGSEEVVNLSERVIGDTFPFLDLSN